MRLFQTIRAGLGAFEKSFLWAVALPLLALHVVLKAWRVWDRGQLDGALQLIDLFKSELLFHAGFALLGLVCLLAVRRSLLKAFGFGALLLTAALVAGLEVTSHRFFLATGSTLDFFLLSFAIEQFDETWAVVASEVPTSTFVLLGASCAAILTLPWPVIWLWKRRERRRVAASLQAPPAAPGARALLATLGVSVAMFTASALPPMAEPYIAFARASVVNMTITMAEMLVDLDGNEAGRKPLTELSLVAREAGATPRNVVFIVLESTRARSVSVYDERLETTPYLAELAEESIVADRAYAVVPHTSKALVATLCGIEPRLNMPITESLPDAIPARCLADLLAEQGYATAFFQSATEAFEGRRQLVTNMGYETFVPNEEMPKRGFEKANYFGYEDRIMLEPSRRWLRSVKNRPFFATYLTLTPHHDYLAPRRYGRHPFDPDDELNRYLNTVHYIDNFVRELIEQYRALGLYENTVFVIVGDHGEGFGEHGRRQHDNVIYEEGIHVPLMIHAPHDPTPRRVASPVSQIDLVPTVLDLLGFEVEGGEYPGEHLLHSDPQRTVFAHCWYERRCMASLIGDAKFIHHFNGQPDEFFDLEADPLERENVIAGRTDAGLRRLELMNWRYQVNGMYRVHNQGKLEQFVFDTPPDVEHEVDVTFGPWVRLVGYNLPHERVRPGERFQVSYVFEVLEELPRGYKLFVHGLGGGRMLNLDHVPVSGLYPLDEWKRGQFVVDVHDIRVPANWRAPELAVLLGIYHPKHGRAEVGGPGLPRFELDDSRLRLFSIPVGR